MVTTAHINGQLSGDTQRSFKKPHGNEFGEFGEFLVTEFSKF